SAYYFGKLHWHENMLVKLVRRYDPSELFAKSATRAIRMHFPEASDTFGSYKEIIKCLRR
ncbi:MAG TPA: hypothetical protein VNI77_04980, partial [Nitrososphaera sp.]|nr:hypothetical protein [Nitrososphaera sp.]